MNKEKLSLSQLEQYFAKAAWILKGPVDAAELMADLVFKPIADRIKDNTYSIYDGASGTGGIDAFFKNEIVPFAPDAWIDKSKTQIGYELSFTKYFYKPVSLRPLAGIKADILALEHETEGMLNEIIKM
jgi:hypothetical protein